MIRNTQKTNKYVESSPGNMVLKFMISIVASAPISAFEEGLIYPGYTFVSTDSHANILGALGAFGQGMGDIDITHAFAHGKIWF